MKLTKYKGNPVLLPNPKSTRPVRLDRFPKFGNNKHERFTDISFFIPKAFLSSGLMTL